MKIKKAKVTKKNVIKQKHKLGEYINFLEANLLEKDINHLEKGRITKNVYKNNKLMLK